MVNETWQKSVVLNFGKTCEQIYEWWMQEDVADILKSAIKHSKLRLESFDWDLYYAHGYLCGFLQMLTSADVACILTTSPTIVRVLDIPTVSIDTRLAYFFDTLSRVQQRIEASQSIVNDVKHVVRASTIIVSQEQDLRSYTTKDWLCYHAFHSLVRSGLK